MTSSLREMLARAGAESSAHVEASRISSNESAAHVRDFKYAIDRSLELLRRTGHHGLR